MGKKVVIVGGVAGGASCATRLRRLDSQAEIVMIDRGPYVSFANCGLPYHVGGVIESRESLLAVAPETFRTRFRIDVRTEHECLRLDRAKQEIEIRDLRAGRVYREPYDVLVLSPGAKPIRPPWPGIDLPGVLALRDIPDMDAILERLARSRARRAVVVGAGYIGLEMAENLRHRGLDVALVEKLPQVMGIALDPEMAELLHRELRRHGVDLRLGVGVAGFEASDGDRLRVRLDGGEPLECDLAILSIGVRPETALGAEAGLAIGPLGGFAVDRHLQTNDPAIYAVGDAVETPNLVTGRPMLCALAGPANRQGRLVAERIAGKEAAYRGSQATAICKVFERTVAAVGLTMRGCAEAGLEPVVAHVEGHSHAGYYPGAETMLLKLLFAPESGAILGAQIVGGTGVDKRIDVLATAQRAGMTVDDLAHLELAYAPPYGTAKDLVNVAGFVAVHHREGEIPLADWAEVEAARAQGETGAAILDVRRPDEYDSCAPPATHRIPLASLPERCDELPFGKKIFVYCAAGARSAQAVSFLRRRGYDARNVSGGTQVHEICTPGPARRG